MRKTHIITLLIGCVLTGISFASQAFDINPFKKYDGSRDFELDMSYSAGIVASIILNPVHEELTIRTLFFARDNKLPGYQAIDDVMIKNVIRGIHWNDDPLYLLPDHAFEWWLNFRHSSDISYRLNSNFDLFYRSHHHDLQFLHSMASNDSEPATVTQQVVLAWIEFTYKVSTGQIPITTRFSHLKKYLSPPAMQVFSKHFMRNGRRLNWTPAYLFALTCNREVTLPDSFSELDCSKTKWRQNKSKIRDIALGSLLHVIQDSFSDSHVTRNPQYEDRISFIHGRSAIVTFNAYNKQSFNLHRGADSYPKDFDDKSQHGLNGYNLEDVSADLVSKVLFARSGHHRNNGWNKLYFELKTGLFRLLKANAIAGSGKYK